MLSHRVGPRSVSDPRIWFAVEHSRVIQARYTYILSVYINCLIVLLEMVIKLPEGVCNFQIRELRKK
jgi:hypothetical protein